MRTRLKSRLPCSRCLREGRVRLQERATWICCDLILDGYPVPRSFVLLSRKTTRVVGAASLENFDNAPEDRGL